MNDNLNKAISMLTSKFPVVPEKYTIYNGAYLFLAYPKGLEDKESCMTPHYLVDLKLKEVGLFSPAFDMKGFMAAAKNMKSI